MGVVCQARDVRFDRFVALKYIALHPQDSPHSRRRFADVAPALAPEVPRPCRQRRRPPKRIRPASKAATTISRAWPNGPNLTEA